MSFLWIEGGQNCRSCNFNVYSFSVNGNWGHWSAFSDTGRCSVTCCRGIVPQRRTRECNDPPPSGGGATCPGPSVETRNGVCGSDTELANQCPCK